MLWNNIFQDGGALMEREPQGDASVPVSLPGHEEVLAALLTSPEASEALARLFLAGGQAAREFAGDL